MPPEELPKLRERATWDDQAQVSLSGWGGAGCRLCCVCASVCKCVSVCVSSRCVCVCRERLNKVGTTSFRTQALSLAAMMQIVLGLVQVCGLEGRGGWGGDGGESRAK
eukprot:3569818-Rhodomonas_salina.1